MTKPSIFRYEGHNYLVPFLIISSLFFMWGFARGILEVLNPHFQESFHISKAMSALTQTAVYGAYFLMALPAGWIIRKWGYRRGVITGLVLFGIGALTFIPGSRINSFYFFVLSLFVIGCGLTCLETSANPYTTVLGHPDKAESRINLSQSLNGIGWIVGPLVGGQLLFSGVNIAIPYALVGIFVLSVALVLSRIKLPDPRRAHEADTNEMVEEKPMRVMAFGFGMLTLFLYVAAQTGVNSFFINYAEESIHIEKQTASLYLAFGGMGLFFIGRLAGGVIMNYIQPRLVLLVCAILTFVATLIVVVCSGTLSLIAFFALYLGESIMFPTIFSLALRDAGTKTKLASSLLIMTIVGGAVAPLIMGYIADTTGSMAIAFLIPLVCYGGGDWNICVIETPRSSLDKISCTRQFESKLSLRSFAKSLDKRIFSKITPSLFTLKEGSTSHPDPLSSGAREKTALLDARNRYVLRLVGHQSPRHLVRAGTAWGKLVCCVSYSCKLCKKI